MPAPPLTDDGHCIVTEMFDSNLNLVCYSVGARVKETSHGYTQPTQDPTKKVYPVVVSIHDGFLPLFCLEVQAGSIMASIHATFSLSSQLPLSQFCLDREAHEIS